MDLNAYCGFSFSKMNNHLHIVETTYTHSNTRIHVQVECIASLFISCTWLIDSCTNLIVLVESSLGDVAKRMWGNILLQWVRCVRDRWQRERKRIRALLMMDSSLELVMHEFGHCCAWETLGSSKYPDLLFLHCYSFCSSFVFSN
jgi:hypothetical protein